MSDVYPLCIAAKIIQSTLMAEHEKQWQHELLQACIPKLVAQLGQIESIFEIYVHALSELHHRLTSILVQEPPMLTLRLSVALHGKIVGDIEMLHQGNRDSLASMAAMLKDYKGALSNLASYQQHYAHKSKDLQRQRLRLSEEYKALISQQKQLQSKANCLQCRYNPTEALLNFNEFLQRNRLKFVREQLEVFNNELKEIQKKQEGCWDEGNLWMRNCLKQVTCCVSKITGASWQKSSCDKPKEAENKFETFGKEENRPEPHFMKQSKQNKGRVSEFDQAQGVIQEAELNCEVETYRKPAQAKTKKVLQAAILAESKEESEYLDLKSRAGRYPIK